ncbi:MAG: hypothetical protein KDA99_02235 [Planctomycetales bacterium]|nr:hypothetical protein [Planctomycetales bacterium]
MEFFEVRLGATIDPMRFVYQPGNATILDDTESYLGQFGISRQQVERIRAARGNE